LKDEEGKLKGFMAIETDITERVIFREELIMAKKIAEKAQLAEKTFLANMSHEIRTPLNAIIGMTSLLKDTNLTYEQNDYIETLDYSSKFLLRLINDILDLAKMESGKMELQKQAFDIRKLFNSIYQVSVLNLKTKDVQINLEIDPKIPKTLIGDEVLLQQALNNLVSNAEKFTQKGNIQLTVNLLNILENSAIVEIIINDSGIGISKENQKHIFDKFKQVGRQTKEQTGTGLGLAITKDIVELYKGTISVESTLGIGTTFKMIIPLTVPSEEIQEKQAKASIDKKEKNGFLKALVVEDNFINQKYIIRLLERLNFKYDIAENGREAIELIFDNYYDVILMDIQMPEMNGYDATYMIRNSKNKNQNSIIIALTASSMSNQRVKAKRMGMNGYLSKPFTPQELNETFKEFNLVQ
jgi:CheY-like chemotaxis protein/nitrogen-specific signal transduction histidine kinase